MILPISGIIQLFGFLVMFFLGYRFLKYGKKDKNQIAEFFGYSFLLISGSRFFLAIPALIFLKDPNLWLIFEIIQRSFLVVGTSVLGYLVYQIKFPNQSKEILLFFVFFSIFIVLGFVLTPPKYFFTNQGILIWNDVPMVPSVLNFLHVLIVIIPAVAMFFKEARLTKIKKVKVRSIVMGLAIIWSVIPGILDFFLVPYLKLNPLLSEVNYLFFFVLLLATVLLSRLFE